MFSRSMGYGAAGFGMSANRRPYCFRCGKETHVTMVSKFNMDECCLDCIDAEKNHPDYTKASEAEHAALLRGEYNFPGIGKPFDL